MSVDEIMLLKLGTKVVDYRTGESYRFSKYESPYAVCNDEEGVTVWLVPERLDVKHG